MFHVPDVPINYQENTDRPMRQIVLDTETTGLEPEHGHRIIEIGAVEMVDRRLTGRDYHVYINPERDIEDGALEVHGLTEEFLSDKPRFAEIADELRAFVEGAELVIHNAPFDLGFLDYEFRLMGHGSPEFSATVEVLDTLELARDLHPGQRNNLDALCRRYEIDNSSRTLHGALLDAGILAEVYLAMTGGQTDLGLTLEKHAQDVAGTEHFALTERAALKVLRASEEEIAQHRRRLRAIEKQAGECLWLEQEKSMA
jgi:DNA polymerase-3 subunit epsilon